LVFFLTLSLGNGSIAAILTPVSAIVGPVSSDKPAVWDNNGLSSRLGRDNIKVKKIPVRIQLLNIYRIGK
jgi:hypothetical protein